MPNAPEYIKGVINFRGEIIPVVELRSKLNIPKRDANEKYITIILELNIAEQAIKLGAIADKVTDVITISKKEIKDVPELGSTFNSNFLNGMIERDTQFIMLLDVDKVFSEEEIEIVQSV